MSIEVDYSEYQEDEFEKLRRILNDNRTIQYHFFQNFATYREDKSLYLKVDGRWEDQEMEDAIQAVQEMLDPESALHDDPPEEELENQERKENQEIIESLRDKYHILSEYDARTFRFGAPDPILHNVLSAAVIQLKLGEGLLDFIYADFETSLTKNYRFARRMRMLSELYQKDTPPKPDPKPQTEKIYDAQQLEVDQYFRYQDTLLYAKEAMYQSLYTAICPPVFSAGIEPEKMINRYAGYLFTLQRLYREALDFCFNPDLFPETLGTLMPHERYSLFLAVKGYIHAHDRSERFILSQTHRGGTAMPYGMSSQELSNRIIHFQLTDSQRQEMAEFSDKYHVEKSLLEAHLRFPSFINVQYGFSSVEEALELEFTKVLEAGVTFRKCKRCGKFFIMKGNYDTNYCDRIAEGSTRTCQELAAQENYQKKMADNAAIPMYNKYYKRYAARVKVRQIKEADFKRWKYEAISKRDACTDGQITIEDYEAWLEAAFPNRKKKEKGV